MKQLFKISGLIIGAFLIFSSCSDDEVTKAYSDLDGNIFIVNEGSFQSNSGKISMYDRDSSTLVDDIFKDVNQRPLGDVVQSFELFDNNTKATIVVNNSQKIEFVDMKNFSSLGTVAGLSYPRHCIEGKSGFVYVSNGNGQGDKLYKINADSYSIIDSIQVGVGPERMIKKNGFIYITNSGSWSIDSTVSVLDIATDKVVATIKVHHAPLDIATDANDKIWVLCKGGTTYSLGHVTNTKIIQIDPKTNTVTKTIDLGVQSPSYGGNILAMSKDGKSIFYENGGIYKISIDDTTPATSALIAGNFYGIDVDPETGNIWATEAPFSGNGKVYIYSETGSKISEFEAGEYPTATVFY